MFNLERHIRSRHKTDLPKSVTNLPKSVTNLPKSVTNLPKSVTNLPKSVTCTKCGKEFKRNTNLQVHAESCNGLVTGQCETCFQVFPYRMALYRHKKECTGPVATPSNTSCTPAVQNITINIANSNIGNSINLLTFPEEDDGLFDFVTSKINQGTMKRCVSASKAEVGFNRFMGAILEHVENQIVRKSNPNVNYSKIHKGDGEWILAHDRDVYPVMTHHMTTAALAKLEEFNKSMRHICDHFRRFVDIVNTDDECKEYQNTIQRLKLIIVNMTQQIEAAEKRVLKDE